MGAVPLKGFLGAVSLLTRVPTRGEPAGGRAVPWLPVVGTLIGAIVAAVYAGARELLTPAVAATLAVGSGVLLTGALHEDGFADTADAFGARADRERALEIMNDPRHGSYGILAIVLSVIARVAAVASMGPASAAGALVAGHAAGRSAAACLLGFAPNAEGSGLGASYAATTTRRQAAIAGAVGALVTVGLLGAWGFVAMVITVLIAMGVGMIAVRKIRGVTGDVLGAAEQLTEIAVLLVAVAVRDGVPWW